MTHFPKFNGFKIVLWSLAIFASVFSTAWAEPDRGLPADQARGPNERGVFGGGRAIRAQDLPAGKLRKQLENLPEKTRNKALKNLERLSFHKSETESINVDYGGEVFYTCGGPKTDCGGCAHHDHHSEPATEEDGEIAYAGGEVSYGDNPEIEFMPPGSTGSPFNPTGPVPIASQPVFHSMPGAQKVVFLDFRGGNIQNTRWNSTSGVSQYVCRPFDTDGDSTTFSIAEQQVIYNLWQRVAEDFAPFNINVTTEQPAQWTSTTGHVMITPPVDANGVNLPHNGYNGVAYTNVFGGSSYSYNANNCSSPAWVQVNSGSNYGNTADTASHEFGHNLGLSHDGVGSEPYSYGYAGTSEAPSWGPLMGAGYNRNLSQWSKGEYLNASLTGQDDCAVIAGKLGYRTDEHGDNVATATELALDGTTFFSEGIILRPEDTDAFAIPSGGGTLTVNVQPFNSSVATWGGNLDAELIVYNQNGEIVASSNPPTLASASISVTVPAGTYYAFVSPVGAGDPLSSNPSGYTVYGSRGTYTISGTSTAPPPPTYPTISSQPVGAMWNEGQSHSLSVTASGGSGLEYQWRKNGSAIPGAGFSTYTVPSVSLSDAGSYDVVVSNSVGTVTSSAVNVTVNAKPVVTVVTPSLPGDVRLESGTGVILEVTATDDGAGGSTLTSEWSVVQAPDGESVTWDNQDTTATAAKFSADGEYVLRYSASDGTHVITRDFNITVGTIASNPSALIVHYNMNESSGTTMLNSARDDYHASLLGNASFTGNTLLLNDGYVTIPSGPDIDTSGPYAKRTVAFRFKRNKYDLQVLYEEGAWLAGFSVILETNNRITLRFWNTVSGTYRDYSATITDNGLYHGFWNHVAVVLDATPSTTAVNLEPGALRLYLNGELRITGNGNSLVSHPDGIGLGGINKGMRTGSNSAFSNSNGGLPFKGEMDDFRLYNRALNAEEIQAIHNKLLVNIGPHVNAGETATSVVDTASDLSGSALDTDGPQPVGVVWSQVSGPGSIAFGSANTLNTTATASVAGIYQLRLTAHDGAIKTFHNVQLEVLPSTDANFILFDSATHTMTENSGSLELRVRRVGSVGAISVSYAAQDITATNGVDYQLSPGVLSWADQETGVKTIPISTIDDLLVDGSESFNVVLSNPTGGAELQDPDIATVTILDDDEAIAPHRTMEIAFNNMQGRETLTDFPLLVKLTPANTNNYAGFLDSTNGWDLRFWTEPGMKGVELSYEIESFDTSGTSSIWVKVPKLNQGTSIWATWGNADHNFQASYTTNGDVWSSGFVGVWHLGEANGVADLTDSTANNNHADLNVGTTNVDGLIGKGQAITNRGDYIRIPHSSSLSVTGSITLEAWGNLPSFPSGAQNIMAKGGNAAYRYRIQNSGATFWSLGNDGSSLETDNVSYPFSVNTWYHLSCVMDFSTSQVRFYVNGTQAGAPQALQISSLANTSEPLLLGQYLAGNTTEGFLGVLDEMRVTNGARSADWIWASAINQGASHGTFQSYGPVIDRDQLAPIMTPSHLVTTAASATQIDLVWRDNSDNEDGFVIERSVAIDSGFSALATVAANATSYSDSSVLPNTTYYYRIRAISAVNMSYYSDVSFLTTPHAPIVITLGDLAQTYDGSFKSISVTTDPPDISTIVTYNGNATPPANAGSYAVIASVNQTGYTGSTSGTFVIAKATPTVSTWPAAGTILEGQPISSGTLTGGNASVPGTYSYDAPDSILNSGVHTVDVTFTPTDSTNYNLVTGTIDVTVSESRSVPEVVGQPQASAETMITDAGLTVGTTTNAYHESIPAGVVISQNPAGTTQVALGSAVNLVISDGPEPDTTPPTVVSFSPLDNAGKVSISTALVVTFSEDVVFGTGEINIHRSSDDLLVASYDVANPPANLSLSGAVLTITPVLAFQYENGYYVTIAPTAIKDPSNNSYAGIDDATTWNFTTQLNALLFDDFNTADNTNLNLNLTTRQYGTVAPSQFTKASGSSQSIESNTLRTNHSERVVNDADFKAAFTQAGVLQFTLSFKLRNMGSSWVSSYLSTDPGGDERGQSRFGMHLWQLGSGTALTAYGDSGSGQSSHNLSKAALDALLGSSFTANNTNTFTFVATPTTTTAGTYDLFVNGVEALSDIPYLLGSGGTNDQINWESNNNSSGAAYFDDLHISRSLYSAPTWSSNPIPGAEANEGMEYSGDLASYASGAIGHTLTFAKVSGPAWLNVTTDGMLSGIPSSGDFGENSFSVSVSDGVSDPVVTTLELTVIPTTPSITYSGNGHTGGTAPVDQNSPYSFGATVSVLGQGDLVKFGYAFTGWNTAADGSGTDFPVGGTFSITSDTTLYAQWIGQASTVSFDANGGITAEPTSKQVNFDSTYGSLATTSRAGYTFLGWFTAASGGTEVTAATVVSTAENHTLHAQWNALSVVNAGSNQVIEFSGAGSWTPAEITTVAWYDASDTATITGGTAVSQWRDKAGTNHLNQGTASARSASGTRTINGLNVIDFDGTSDFMTMTSSVDLKNKQVLFVLKKDTAAASMFFSETGKNSQFTTNTADPALLRYAASPSPYWTNERRSTQSFAATETMLGGFIGTSDLGFSVNGTHSTSAGNDGGSQSIIDMIGRRGDGDHDFLDGVFAEIVFLPTTDTTDRQKAEGYLAHKWGLAGNLPAEHPYKSVGPGTPAAVATLNGTVTDPESDPVTHTWTRISGPAPVQFADASALDTTATFTAEGVYTLRLTASDGYGTSFDEVVITVGDPPNTAPEWTAGPLVKPGATVGAAYIGTLADDATDADANPLTFAKVSGPVWLAIAADGTLSGTPESSDAGSNSFTVSVTDGFSTPVQNTLNIDVMSGYVAYITDAVYGIPSDQRGFSDDPDYDGLPNGVESALGTHPGQSNPGMTAPSVNGTTITFTHPVNPDFPADVSLDYQWSTNLTLWYAGDGLEGPLDGPRVTITSVTEGETTTVSAISNQSQNRIFLRIAVSQN